MGNCGLPSNGVAAVHCNYSLDGCHAIEETVVEAKRKLLCGGIVHKHNIAYQKKIFHYEILQ